MAITRAEAADALRDVERTTERTHVLRGYRHASPHLILWGAIWVLGYAAMGVLPQEQWGWVWLGLDLVGVAGSATIAGRAGGGLAAEAGRGPGMAAMFAVMVFIVLFVVATYTVFAPRGPESYLVFPALVLGLVYVAAGAWKMPRLAWVGAAVFALSMAGYFLARDSLAFWLAAVGGGGLILGGLWLRRM
jgi:hypothetical protein